MEKSLGKLIEVGRASTLMKVCNLQKSWLQLAVTYNLCNVILPQAVYCVTRNTRFCCSTYKVYFLSLLHVHNHSVYIVKRHVLRVMDGNCYQVETKTVNARFKFWKVFDE